MGRVRRLPKRREVWVADLRFSGIEISKIRPVLIISSNIVNEFSPRVIIIPATSQTSMFLSPDRVFISKENSGLKRDSVFIATQVRALDKSKLVKRVGVLKNDQMKEIEESIKVVLDLIEA